MTIVPANPSALATFEQIEEQCTAVETWAAECEDVAQIKDNANKLAAIDEYLSRTSTDGRKRVSAAMRRLEARIGELVGPAPGKGSSHRGQRSDRDQTFDPKQESDFRKMAAHPDVVEDVIAGSTDEEPPSRRKVMRAIDLADAVARYPFLDGVPAKEAEVVATANGLDSYEGDERERRIGIAKKWVEMKRRRALAPEQRTDADAAAAAVQKALTGLVSWNVDAARAIEQWSALTDDPAMEGEWDGAIRFATDHLKKLSTLASGSIRRLRSVK